MTPRIVLIGFASVALALTLLIVTSHTAGLVLGGLLLVVGAAILIAAGALGVRAKDPVAAATADDFKDGAEGTAMRRSSEHGQWQRTSAGL